MESRNVTERSMWKLQSWEWGASLRTSLWEDACVLWWGTFRSWNSRNVVGKAGEFNLLCLLHTNQSQRKQAFEGKFPLECISITSSHRSHSLLLWFLEQNSLDLTQPLNGLLFGLCKTDKGVSESPRWGREQVRGPTRGSLQTEKGWWEADPPNIFKLLEFSTSVLKEEC